jgi:putative monooxygenase
MRAALALALVAACGSSDRPVAEPDPTAGITPDPGDAAVAEPGPTPEEEAQIVALSQMANATAAPVRACVARAAADDFRVQGALTLAIRFGAIGTAPQVTALADTVGDPVLTGCISALVAGYGWPRDVFEAGSTLELPLHFTAPSAQYTIDLEHVPQREVAGGDLRVKVAMDTANTGDPGAAVSLMEIAEGATVPLHRHPAAEEILFLVEGGGRLWGLAGERKATEVGSGWLLRFPAGTAHAYRATSDNLAIQIYAPAGPEQRFEGVEVPDGTVPVAAAEQKKPARNAPSPIAIDVRGSAAGKALQAPRLSQLPEAGLAAHPVYVGEVSAEPGSEVASHTHEGYEVVLVRGGTAVVTIDGDPHPVGPGHAVKIPPGVPHAWKVVTDLQAIQLFVAAPPGAP